MQPIDRLITRALPQVYLANRWVELAFAAAFFTLLILLFIKLTRLLPRVRSARQQMIAAAYEIYLYRNRPRMVLRAQWRCIWNNLKLLLYLSPALVFGGVLFALFYGVLSDRYGYGPAGVGANVVIRARAVGEVPDAPLLVEPASDNVLLTGHVHVASIATTWSRLRASSAGIHPLRVGGHEALRLNVATPGRPAIPRQFARRIDLHVDYPIRKWWGLETGWMLYFLVICLIASIPLGRRL